MAIFLMFWFYYSVMDEKNKNFTKIVSTPPLTEDKFSKTQAVQNPIEADSFEYDNEIQIYFNRKYLKINTVVKDAVCALSEKGRIKGYIDDTLLEVSALASQYFYDGTLPEHKEKKYSMAHNTLIITDKAGNVCCVAQFKKQMLSKITSYRDDIVKEIYFRDMNFMARLLDKNPKVMRYEKKNMDEQLIEALDFNQAGMAEKYVSYKNSKARFEILFDTDTISMGIADKTKLIPKKYTEYCPDNYSVIKDKIENPFEDISKTVSIKYLYARPVSYSEFNPKTGRQIKHFKMQGLKNTVYKYSFHNPFTGEIEKSGSL